MIKRRMLVHLMKRLHFFAIFIRDWFLLENPKSLELTCQKCDRRKQSIQIFPDKILHPKATCLELLPEGQPEKFK